MCALIIIGAFVWYAYTYHPSWLKEIGINVETADTEYPDEKRDYTEEESKYNRHHLLDELIDY